ncbi:MAG: glycoside hydrolase family 2 [Chloroflexi bacterium]|nr:glycoside hydrolase family 2 [Chloroflexota bacterium]
MHSIRLDGAWRVAIVGPADHPIGGPHDLISDEIDMLPARVPGNIELDLVRAGRISDPFLANNTRQLRSLECNDYWYLREFEMPAGAAGQDWDLVFAGLDTLATVWVNGVEVGSAANMLIEHRFDVTDALCPESRNQVVVRLASALRHAQGLEYDVASMSWERREEGLFIRKAPHVWGWDIMPRAVSAGIWRSVWLEVREPVAIEQLYYWTERADRQNATLGLRFQFRTDSPDLDGYSLSFRGVCGDHVFEHEEPVEFIAGGALIPVPDARLWWPKGYGDPHQYTITARLCRRGAVVAERVDRVGIRTVRVDRTTHSAEPFSAGAAVEGSVRVDCPAAEDGHFVFVVNGEPVMVKGANWVPLDAFHSRDAERVGPALALFDDLGCNMVRCWGGNVYEDRRFFDLCDQMGIMVWQDFAFACCRYPQTEPFLAQVRSEVEAVVRRLRNHPSLVLWCGDNEVDMAYASEGLPPEWNRLTREVIPGVLRRCDPHRDYVPSSPYIPSVLHADRDAALRTPEQHLWGPRGYFKGDFYARHSACFIGEIGYHGCPNVSSIQRFISPDSLWPWQDNDEWLAHSVHHWQHRVIYSDRVRLMVNQVRELFGTVPDDLGSFALASQITQAEAKKFFVESTRLRKWRTSGILWWNVLDGWPQFSDAVVDYYFGKKLAYHYLWRVQRPVCMIVGEPGRGNYLPLIVSNDSLQTVAVHFSVRDGDSQEQLLEGALAVPANQNWQVGRIRAFAGEQRLLLLEWTLDGERYGNHYVACHPPFSLDRYRVWLRSIARLPRSFEADDVAA